jgi:hypothetical protein
MNISSVIPTGIPGINKRQSCRAHSEHQTTSLSWRWA